MDAQPTGPMAPPKPDADGNYDSPALRALGKVWEAFLEEQAGPGDVIGVIAKIGDFAYSQLRLLEKQVEDGVSNPDEEAFSLIFEAFEILLEGCEFLALEFAEEIPEDLEVPPDGFFLYGYDLIQEATNQMMRGHTLAMEHIEAMADVNCPFCEQVNSRENTKCDKCGRPLMTAPLEDSGHAVDLVERQGLEKRSPGGGAAADEGLTKNYMLTAELLERWKAGSADAEELEKHLDQMENGFLGHLGETKQHEQMIKRAPAAKRAALMEALEMTRQGLNLSLDAIEKMRLAFDNEDDRYLFFGLTDLEEASRVLVDAYWANKEAAK